LCEAKPSKWKDSSINQSMISFRLINLRLPNCLFCGHTQMRTFHARDHKENVGLQNKMQGHEKQFNGLGHGLLLECRINKTALRVQQIERA